ncbi:pelargonidin 3-O-(6-caffeoylglucoside) 5-O-(6-O-malonylglucoside) 4'''-malonyltransferase-like [Solanum stenotomum]|uniref:pelargonidin 3-O-(6-caffeoylglucoside) 5-O-(6-O-malonylglucoside) 4'''-malonyltransferase-like n=1 Tax=Solanum stenotomum TaxID=172797 RepID=UPI0020D0F798|nr:pelargonidin 3-O-(6-caffeoylglucoside) 5-O-(6-O-malonylglucoside) 4'''-malonyltransferase-like [Solanum stenotomum]
MEIKILCTKLIKPFLPTPPHLQRYKISFFDQISEKEHVSVVFFFHNYNNFNMDERLEQSLSKVLTHVYPAAGRYDDKDECCSILCLDQGVSYTKAMTNGTLDNFLDKARNDFGHAALFSPHVNKNINETNFMVSPIVTIQVTKFECDGLAISISTSHPAMDGFSDFQFISEWAKVCRMGTSVDKINFLSFNMGDIFPTRDVSELFKSTPIPVIQQDIVVKKIVIREPVMSRLRKKCIDESDGALIFQPSRVEIITALLWRAFIRATTIINGYLRPSLLDFPMNMRSKITFLPQVKNSFGNFMIGVPVKFIPGETKMELHHFIILIRNAVNKIVASCKNANSPDEIVSMLVNSYNESFRSPEWGGNDGVDKVMCTSICKFPVHDSDFGLGKSNLIFFGMKDTQMFWLHDIGPEIGVQVDLKESCMQLFDLDDDIKDLIFIRDAKL